MSLIEIKIKLRMFSFWHLLGESVTTWDSLLFIKSTVAAESEFELKHQLRYLPFFKPKSLPNFLSNMNQIGSRTFFGVNGGADLGRFRLIDVNMHKEEKKNVPKSHLYHHFCDMCMFDLIELSGGGLILFIFDCTY